MPPKRKYTAIKRSTSSQYLPPPTPTPDFSYESLKILVINQEKQIKMPFNPRTMIYPELSDFEIIKRLRNLKKTDSVSLKEHSIEFMKLWLRRQNIDYQLRDAYLFITALGDKFEDEFYPCLGVIATVDDAYAIAEMIEAKFEKASGRRT